jgi:RimJ/RimL family protein N-acetyltransferase
MDDIMNAMTVPTLTGQRVTLRAVQPEDEHARLSLGWHAAIQRNYGQLAHTRQMTPAEARTWYEQHQARGADPSRRYWAIEAEGQLVGGAGLDALKETDRKGTLVIGMFAPSHMGRGLGTAATRLVLGHAFGSMNLHRVDLRVLAFNHGAIASYRKCGFVQEGRERDSCWLDGHWYDDIIMALLATEFSSAG